VNGPPEEFTFNLVSGPPVPPPNPWVGLAVGLAVIVAVAALARWRARRADQTPPRRRARILWASASGAGAMTAMLVPEQLARNAPFEPSIEFGLLVHFVSMGVLALMLLGTADLLLDAFRPRRSRAWLAIAPLLLAAFVTGTLAATGWLGTVSTEPDPHQLMLVLAGIAAGLTWWSHLPAPANRSAGVFE
jgi:hypothetical protein